MDSGLGGTEKPGTLRQYVVVKDEHLVRAPRNLTFEEAAAFPTAAGTAMHGLGKYVSNGTTVLSQGTGGLATAMGARVIATSSADDKLRLAEAIGAKDLINYRKNPDWADEALRLTDGRGVDLVIDVGGAGTIEQSLKALRQGGTVAVIGILTPAREADLVPAILFGGKTVRGVLSHSKTMLEDAIKIFEMHDLHPVLAATYEWRDASAAYEALKQQTAPGKIVIKV